MPVAQTPTAWHCVAAVHTMPAHGSVEVVGVVVDVRVGDELVGVEVVVTEVVGVLVPVVVGVVMLGVVGDDVVGGDVVGVVDPVLVGVDVIVVGGVAFSFCEEKWRLFGEGWGEGEN